MRNIIILFLLALVSCTKVQEKIPTGTDTSLKSLASGTNVIFILADDFGYEVPTFDGGQSYETPVLDSLASHGIKYSQAHVQPLCSPTRQGLLTGKNNYRNYQMWGHLSTDNRTIANVFRDAGYRTACFGKWQLDGGDAAIHSLGFDEYAIFLPYAIGSEEDSIGGGEGNRYKNPKIYTHGAYIDSMLTLNQYGEDIFTDSLISFISQPSDKPFFIYYPMVLTHPPFSPTPDDSAFAGWTTFRKSDTTYYRSMVKYMDKKIGQITHALDSLGLSANTKIVFIGDNGTMRKIYSLYNGRLIQGGKGTTTELGIHVPLVITGNGTGTSQKLIDYTDIYPTLAYLGGIPIPVDSTLDGINIFSAATKSSLYYWYWVHPDQNDTTRRSIWVQGKVYKRYGQAGIDYKENAFYAIATTAETIKQIITPLEMTDTQRALDSTYKAVIDSKQP